MFWVSSIILTCCYAVKWLLGCWGGCLGVVGGFTPAKCVIIVCSKHHYVVTRVLWVVVRVLLSVLGVLNDFNMLLWYPVAGMMTRFLFYAY